MLSFYHMGWQCQWYFCARRERRTAWFQVWLFMLLHQVTAKTKWVLPWVQSRR